MDITQQEIKSLVSKLLNTTNANIARTTKEENKDETSYTFIFFRWLEFHFEIMNKLVEGNLHVLKQA